MGLLWSAGGKTTYQQSESKTDSSSKGSEAGTSSTRRLGGRQLDELSRTMAALQRDVEEEDAAYSKGAAIRDTKGLVDQIFKDYRETSLPNILSQQSQAGAYSSTGTQLLANDAYARTTGQASAAVMQAISDYAGIQTSRRNAATGALSTVLQGLISAQEDTAYGTTFNTSSASKTKGRTFSQSLEGSFGM